MCVCVCVCVCVRGPLYSQGVVQVYRSSVPTPLPEGTVLFSMAMRMVQADHYYGLAEFARCGRHKVRTDGRRCGLKIALNPEFSVSFFLPRRQAPYAKLCLCHTSGKDAGAIRRTHDSTYIQ
jgi:hypothetical protein